MTRLRAFAWLIALIAFVVPSIGTATVSHAMAPAQQSASADCPDHAPPPEDCPAQGTAKHAAGQCCPFMAGVVALIPPAVADDAPAMFDARPPGLVPHLSGLTSAKDPPPPRV
jgi:hypothetical protein